MNVLRPITLPVLRSATTPCPVDAQIPETLLFYLLDTDGSLKLVEALGEDDRIVPLGETGSSVTFEISDTLIAAETDFTVTLDLGN